MHHGLDSLDPEDFPQPALVSQIPLNKNRLFRNGSPMALGKVIKDYHPMTPCQQRAGTPMAASGYQNIPAAISFF
jgi:hypothetical protein